MVKLRQPKVPVPPLPLSSSPLYTSFRPSHSEAAGQIENHLGSGSNVSSLTGLERSYMQTGSILVHIERRNPFSGKKLPGPVNKLQDLAD